MDNNEKDYKSNIVDDTLELFDKYSQKRDQWAQQAKEDNSGAFNKWQSFIRSSKFLTEFSFSYW